MKERGWPPLHERSGSNSFAPRTIGVGIGRSSGRRPGVENVRIDWAYRRAAICAMAQGGAISDERVVAADEDRVDRTRPAVWYRCSRVRGVMSGAVWVRDRLQAAGWSVDVANARKVHEVAPLACTTDKIDARGLLMGRPDSNRPTATSAVRPC
jgi:hypothetical protein